MNLQQRNLEGKLNSFVLSPRNLRNNRDGSEHPDFLGLIRKSKVERRDKVDQGSLDLNQPAEAFPAQLMRSGRVMWTYANLHPMQFLTPAENDSLWVRASG